MKYYVSFSVVAVVSESSSYRKQNRLYLFSLSLSLSPVAPTLEHRASVKRFVSLQFLYPRQSVGLLGRVIRPSQIISFAISIITKVP
jgi:hypothetical protein